MFPSLQEILARFGPSALPHVGLSVGVPKILAGSNNITNQLLQLFDLGKATPFPARPNCGCRISADRRGLRNGVDRIVTSCSTAEKDGTRVKPEFGSVWYHFMGADQEHARNHMTIAVPGATAQSLGLPDNNKQGGVWIMNAGTTTAHLMTPGE
jgi:hypothetical protein